MYIATVTAVFVVSRVFWILHYQPGLGSDFLYYHQLALDPTLINESCLGKPLLWPLLLRLGYYATSPDIFTGLVINVFLGLAALLLIYKIAEGFGQHAANIAVTLFILWPDQLTLTSILASEHIATVLMLAGTLCFYRWQKQQRTHYLILTAIFFALAFEARSILGVLITAAIIVLLWKQKWYAALLLILCFIGTHRLYEAILAFQGVDSQPSSIIFSLLLGTNLESSGAWNDNDAMLYGSFLPDCQAANQWALTTSITRLQSGIVTVSNLAVTKMMSFIFFGGGYGMYYNRLVFPTNLFAGLFLLSMFYQLLIALFGIVIILFRRYALPNINYLLLVLFLLSLAHMILEVANRYSYMPMSLWFIIIGAALKNTKSRQPSVQ